MNAMASEFRCVRKRALSPWSWSSSASSSMRKISSLKEFSLLALWCMDRRGNRALGEFGGLNNDVAHTTHQGLEVAYFVKERRLGRLMHLVDGVVHHRDQIADVAAIERRNEGASHGEQDVPRDHVRVVFIALDFPYNVPALSRRHRAEIAAHVRPP